MKKGTGSTMRHGNRLRCDMRRVRDLVVQDPDILGGDPVFRGTRVPVHLIAELVAQGATTVELRHDYPRLTTDMIRLAPVYAAAHPLTSGPRRQAWQVQEPVYRARR